MVVFIRMVFSYGGLTWVVLSCGFVGVTFSFGDFRRVVFSCGGLIRVVVSYGCLVRVASGWS